MAAVPVISFMFMFIAAMILTTAAAPLTFMLERAFPTNHGIHLDELRARDTLRHGRLLKYSDHVVGLDVYGTSMHSIGLYYTKVWLGTPPVEFYLQIDTGSDLLWVSCSSCDSCPWTSGLQIELKLYDPMQSSTSSSIDCSDQRCNTGLCQNNQCAYNINYGTVGGPTCATSGYYVSDRVHFKTVSQPQRVFTKNSSAPIVFGCSNNRTGYITKSFKALDGIIGLGHQDISIISQLSAQGDTPRVFSHCLRGDTTGGGELVLGEVIDPNLVYTPLVLSERHYNLNLESISVNGWALQIDASVFATSKDKGTIVDSGTTLAYLPEDAYDPFVTAIIAAIPHSVHTVLSGEYQCFLTNNSVTTDIFPQVSLNFAGGASMDLRPQDYLIQQNPIDSAAVWCIGFLKIKGQGMTILGDLVLKDKIVVYDLAGERIGWADYDCSLRVNVSTEIGPRHVNTGKFSGSSMLYLALVVRVCLTSAFFLLSVVF